MQRVNKSRMRIVRALEALMEHTPFTKIQVTQLCKEADIGRSTFYDNFDNISDVAIWYWEELMQITLYQIDDTHCFYDAHLKFFMLIDDKKDFFQNAFKATDYSSINSHAYRTLGSFYKSIVEKDLGRALTEEEEAAMHFYNIGASDYCAEWVRTGMKESPEVMAATFTNALPHVMHCLK